MSTLADLQAYAAQVAQQWGIPTSIFDWQINQESSWNPNAQNGNATGIAQFMPGTAAQFGIDPSNPYQSLSAAAQYDAQLYQQTGSWTQALTQYGTLANAGPSLMASFNNVLSGLGIAGSSSTGSTGATQTAGQVAESDSFVTKISMIVLGIVLIGGAIVVYGKSK
jgi:hypothetical protein